METLTGVALARELNGILRGTYIVGAEQADGGSTLLVRLRGRSGDKDAGETVGPAPERTEGRRDALRRDREGPPGTPFSGWLVLSSCRGEAALFLTSERPRVVARPSPAPMARYIKGKTVLSVSHSGLDRTIAVAFSPVGGGRSGMDASPKPPPIKQRTVSHRRKGALEERSAEAATGAELKLFFELFAGQPRAYLVEADTGTIIETFAGRGDAAHREAQGDGAGRRARSGHRGRTAEAVAGGVRYTPPALPSGKVDPWNLSVGVLEGALGLRPSEDDLVRGLFGVGRVLAREVVARSSSTGRGAAEVLRELISQAAEPGARGYVMAAAPADTAMKGAVASTALREETPATPRALPFEPTFDPSLHVSAFATVNEAVREGYLMCRRLSLRLERRGRAVRDTRARLRRVVRTRQTLTEELEETSKSAEVRRKGELILAHIDRISRGQRVLELPAQDHPGTEVLCIALEAHLSAPENAAAYFKRARKLERKSSVLPGRIDELAKEEARLRTEVRKALVGQPDVDAEAPPTPARRPGARGDRWPPGISPRHFTSTDGWTMYVGRDNKENDYITFVLARPDDLWFHAQGVAGSHVILRREGRKSRPSKRCVEETASVAAYFSRGRTSQTVPVIYTEKRYVRKPKKGRPGTALHSNEKSVMVSPGLPPDSES